MLTPVRLLIDKITLQLRKNQHRQVIAFHAADCETSGDAGDELQLLINSLSHPRKLILSLSLKNALPPEKARTCLGEEYDLVVFDAREILNPDALGVVSGVLCGGGVLLLVLPEMQQWINQTSVYVSHVKGLIENNSDVLYLKEINDSFISTNLLVNKNEESQGLKSNQAAKPYRTHDQQQAVERVLELLEAEKDCCVVLTSGRGRGKSTALGLLTAKTVEKRNKANILITAPRRSVADPLFDHLQQQCPEGSVDRAGFSYKQSSVKFIAPDALLEILPEADVLLIDEAAVIPISMLEKLLEHYPQIIFSTTTHGYEGTGRGFILKFYQLLKQKRPDWQEIKLHQPIRWAQNDPLEKWVEELLFLDVRLGRKPEVPAKVEKCQPKLIEQNELIKSKDKLNAVFSLLVFAHYRTSPSDFQYILDSQDVRIYSLEFEQQVLAVLLVNQEGGFDEGLTTAIYRGERRPRGHLLAQTLSFHAGYEAAASFKYARVMRIAVHPGIQQSGYGSYLLQQVIAKEKSNGMDVIGSSFSATKDLLRFWQKGGMSLLRLGFSRDHVSASHSAVVAMSLSDNSIDMIEVLAEKFIRNFPLWLSGPLADVSDDIKIYLKQDNIYYSAAVDSIDIGDVESFALYNRNYDACMPAIVRWLNSVGELPEKLEVGEQEVIKASLEYKNNWAKIVKEIKCTGKTQAISVLRSALKHLLRI